MGLTPATAKSRLTSDSQIPNLFPPLDLALDFIFELCHLTLSTIGDSGSGIALPP